MAPLTRAANRLSRFQAVKMPSLFPRAFIRTVNCNSGTAAGLQPRLQFLALDWQVLVFEEKSILAICRMRGHEFV
jgi:hypothetical protein